MTLTPVKRNSYALNELCTVSKKKGAEVDTLLFRLIKSVDLIFKPTDLITKL